MILSGQVRLTGQNIVIGVADSYHSIASWAEFIHAVYFGQADKKEGRFGRFDLLDVRDDPRAIRLCELKGRAALDAF
jgi:hypothetical protein